MQEFKKLTDEQLVERFKKRQNAVFEVIYSRYKEQVFTLARAFSKSGVDVDDLSQSGFWGLYKAVLMYDENKSGASTFKTFANICIKSAMENAVKDNKLKHTEGISYDEVTEVLEGESQQSPEEEVINNERLKELLESIKQSLSPFEIEVFNLHVQGVKYKEIAQILGKSPKSVDNAIQRIKEKARKL